MNTEEGRLRRDVARGAGGQQIRRLLALIEARESARAEDECPFGHRGEVVRCWPASVAECRIIELKNGQRAVRFKFRVDEPEDAPEAISVHRLEGPLGLGVGFLSTLRALAPELDLVATDYDFIPEAFVGRRANVAVHCHRHDGTKRHFHVVTSIRPEPA